MCLILFAVEAHPECRLILAANRDEFYDRPTDPAGFWTEPPQILAGRDLKLGGTWLGITRNGRFAAVTNYRDPASLMDGAKSRGMLVSRFLLEETSPQTYLTAVSREKNAYNGFNLLVGDPGGLFWLSNRGDGIHAVSNGVHGLSNRLLDTSWPKVARGIRLFSEAVEGKEDLVESCLALLSDRHRPPDQALPETGVGLEWERILSPIFIESPTYGTRSSSVLLVGRNGKITFAEKTFIPGESPVLRRFEF